MTPAAWGVLGLLAVVSLSAWGCACEAERAEQLRVLPRWVPVAWGVLAVVQAAGVVVVALALIGF